MQPFPDQYGPVPNEQPQPQHVPPMQQWEQHYPGPAPVNLQQQQLQPQQPWPEVQQQPANFQAPAFQQPLPAQVPLQPGYPPVEQGNMGVQGQWQPAAQGQLRSQYPGLQPFQSPAPINLQRIYPAAPPPDPVYFGGQPALGVVGHAVPYPSPGQVNSVPLQAAGAPQAGAPIYGPPHNSPAQDQIPQAADIPPPQAQQHDAAGEYYNQSTYPPEQPAQDPYKQKHRPRHHKQPTETTMQPGVWTCLKATWHMHQQKPHPHEDTPARHDYIKRLDKAVNHTFVGKLLPLGATKRGQLQPEAARVGSVLGGKAAHKVDWSGVADGEERKRRHERRLARGASKAPG